jgi:hypothetical protein
MHLSWPIVVPSKVSKPTSITRSVSTSWISPLEGSACTLAGASIGGPFGGLGGGPFRGLGGGPFGGLECWPAITLSVGSATTTTPKILCSVCSAGATGKRVTSSVETADPSSIFLFAWTGVPGKVTLGEMHLLGGDSGTLNVRPCTLVIGERMSTGSSGWTKGTGVNGSGSTGRDTLSGGSNGSAVICMPGWISCPETAPSVSDNEKIKQRQCYYLISDYIRSPHYSMYIANIENNQVLFLWTSILTLKSYDRINPEEEIIFINHDTQVKHQDSFTVSQEINQKSIWHLALWWMVYGSDTFKINPLHDLVLQYFTKTYQIINKVVEMKRSQWGKTIS